MVMNPFTQVTHFKNEQKLEHFNFRNEASDWSLVSSHTGH